jgi:hypothetical protein
MASSYGALRPRNRFGAWLSVILTESGRDDVVGHERNQPSYLYAISGSGAELWRYQLPLTGTGNESADRVQIGDVTGDGKNEVIVGDAASTLFVFDNKRDGLVYTRRAFLHQFDCVGRRG